MRIDWFVLELVIFKGSIFDIKIYFYLDWMRVIFLIVVSLISSWAFFYRKFYIEFEKKKVIFIVLTFLFVISIYLIVIRINLWIVLLGWDGLGLVSFFLVIYYQRDISYYSGIVTVLINRLGDIGIILSIYYIINFYSFDILIVLEDYANLFVVLLILGCFTKRAQFPFSSWLPLAIAAPTPISALVHSSTLVTAGVYIILRLNYIVKTDSVFTEYMILISLITMFIAGFIALFEVDIKKVIALSTLSQLGLIIIIALLGAEVMSFYHLLTHALFKALLFLCSGILIHNSLDTQDVRKFNLTYKINYLVMGVIIVCSLSLIGLPFLRGFYSKDYILEYVYIKNINIFFLLIVLLSTILTSVYSIRLLYLLGIIGKNSRVFLKMAKWESINWPLVSCYLFVLSLGRILGWILTGKLEIIYLTFSIKIINLFLIFIGIGLFIILIKTNNIKLVDYSLRILYITTFQGFFINKILNNIIYYSILSEFNLEQVLIKKNIELFNISFKYLLISKFIVFYRFIIVIVLLLLFFL